DTPIDATRFEFRISAAAGSRTAILAAGVFDNGLDADALPPGDREPLVGKKSGTIIPPPLITRAEWNAEPFRGTPVNLANPTYDFMTWHHAAGYSAENREQGEVQMRAMQQLHQDVRGWSDIGYQFAIDRAGNLYQGRPFMDNSTNLSQVPVLARGAHVGGANTGNVGVVIMGCYHPPEGSHCEQEITPQAFNTYIVLFAFLSERYGIEPSMIRGHRDFSSTACPGNNNYVRIPELMDEVELLLEVGNEPVGAGTLIASTDEDGVVTLNWEITEDFGIQTIEIERVRGDERVVVFSGDTVPDSFSDATLVGGDEVTYVLYASDGQGRRQELARADVLLDLPSGYVLTSSFPNPAADRAEFKYFMPMEGRVTIGLYDAAGRLVSEIENAYRDGDSWYPVSIDLSDRTAGLYFYRITIEGFSGVVFDKSRAIAVIR
ncbi:MAG: T9SS type A sorting domain-containing protein, partial [Rhodothermales bacterium]|nr:T9SS type A sorting domain-containing protein [Rhodothermales bacterium]